MLATKSRRAGFDDHLAGEVPDLEPAELVGIDLPPRAVDGRGARTLTESIAWEPNPIDAFYAQIAQARGDIGALAVAIDKHDFGSALTTASYIRQLLVAAREAIDQPQIPPASRAELTAALDETAHAAEPVLARTPAELTPDRDFATAKREWLSATNAPGHAIPEAMHDAIASESGAPLADVGEWSDEVGVDVSDARLVTGGKAEAAADSISASAFTVGNRVFLGAGVSASSHRHVMRHELTHVAQQRGAATPAIHELKVAPADHHVEHEAHAAETAVHKHGHAPGAGVQIAARPKGAPSPGPTVALDALRNAVASRVAATAHAEYRALRASGKAALRADLTLIGDLLGVLDRPHAHAVLRDLKLDRKATLEVAARGRSADAAFLADVLRQLRIDITLLTVAAGELAAQPAFASAKLLDPIVNAAKVTAKQQLALATAPGGAALLQKVYAGQSPLRCLHKLATDHKQLRDGFAKDVGFATWLLGDLALLQDTIAATLDGAKWARVLWGSHHVLLGKWIDADPSYWGNTFADAFMKPEAGDAAVLRATPVLASSIFSAIGRVRTIDIVVQMFSLLRFKLAEQVTTLSDAGRLDDASLALALDGPTITADEQSDLTEDAEAIALVKKLARGKRPSQVLTILAGDPAKFCEAVGRPGAFSDWIIKDKATLVAEMQSVPNWNGWVDSFYALGNAKLLLEVAANPALQANLRAALTATQSWNWLFTNLPQPVPTQAQVNTIFALYDDRISVVDKYAMWGALFRAKLRRKGDDLVQPKPDGTSVQRYNAVDPNDDAMKFFFEQLRTIPRAHVDTATSVLMCDYWTLTKTVTTGTVKTTRFEDGSGNAIPSPGHVAMTTSWYFREDNIIVMKTNASGAPDTGFDNEKFLRKPGQGPGSVRRARAGRPDMNVFQNHVSHETGHAVGERTLKRGPYQMTGNTFAEKYGQWKKGGGNAEGYARMLGFTSGMDALPYFISDRKPRPRARAFMGSEVRKFLTSIAQGGLSSQAGHPLATFFGGVALALDVIKLEPTLKNNTLFKTVEEQRNDFPFATSKFPYGIGSADKVHFFRQGQWWTYHGEVWHKRVSHYSVSSPGENFAEMYTQKYTNGDLKNRKIGNYDPDVFFKHLTAAGPEELGLAPYSNTKSPGAEAPGDSDARGPGASSADDAEPSRGGIGRPPPPKRWP